MPQQLVNPHELPGELAYLLLWYNTEVRAGRPLEWSDLYYWSKITARPITGFEAEALRAIDSTFWRVYRDGRDQPPQD